MTKKYDPKNVRLIIGGHEIKGFAENEPVLLMERFHSLECDVDPSTLSWRVPLAVGEEAVICPSCRDKIEAAKKYRRFSDG